MGGSRQLMVNNDKSHFAYSKLTKDQIRQLVPRMSGMRLHCLCKRYPLPMQCGALSRWRRHSSVLFRTQKLAQWTMQWLLENSFVCVHKSLLSVVVRTFVSPSTGPCLNRTTITQTWSQFRNYGEY